MLRACCLIDAWCLTELLGIANKAQKHIKRRSLVEMTNKQAYLYYFVVFSHKTLLEVAPFVSVGPVPHDIH